MAGVDLDVRPLPLGPVHEPAELLAEYRRMLKATSWHEQTPDTLISPVQTSADSAARFTDALGQLYLAHLVVLRALIEGGPHNAAGAGYAALAEPVGRFYENWPGLDARLWPDVLGSSPSESELLSLMFGRPDVMLTADGPKVVETNFDTAAAGQERPDDIWVIAADLFDLPPPVLAFGRPLAATADYFVELAGGRPSRFHWVMKDDPVTRAELDPLIATLNLGPGVARHSIHYAGDQLIGPEHREPDRQHLLHRACSIFTVNRDRQRFARLLGKLSAFTSGCTVPVGLSAISSKLFLAWLSDPAARPASLTPRQVAAIESLVPWTRPLSLLCQAELDRLGAERARYVLKKADSHQASEVYLGWDTEPGRWWELLSSHRDDDQPWIVQQAVRPRTYRLTEYTDDGPVQRSSGLFCCPYLMGGRLRGLETWLTAPRSDLSAVRRMHFVANYVAAAPVASDDRQPPGQTPGTTPRSS